MSAVALLHPLQEKNPCPHTTRKNPGGLAQGMRKYREFHQGLSPDRVQRIRVQHPKSLVKLGTADRIDYTREEPGGPRPYFHQFGEESGKKPILASSPDGRELYILGGNFRVKDWIFD